MSTSDSIPPSLPTLQRNTRFADFLARSLSVGTKLRVYHICTPPVSTTPIFAAAPGRSDEPTTCESHFLTISGPHVTIKPSVDHQPTEPTTESTDEPSFLSSNRQPRGKTDQHVLLLGIEVLIFSTEKLQTVFVSKADSTGFLSRTTLTGQRSSSIIQTVIATFLEWLVSRQLSPDVLQSQPRADCVTILPAPVPPNDHVTAEPPVNSNDSTTSKQAQPLRPRSRPLVLSLFARSQNQYLFPGSIENKTKHVLDDRQLIKWWCRVLDGLVQKEWEDGTFLNRITTHNPVDGPQSDRQSHRISTTTTKLCPNAYIVVPGCDRADTIRSFFPSSARYPTPGVRPRWHTSYPAHLLTDQDRTTSEVPLPVRCLIPRLPDDPKARYCDDLDHAGIDEMGRWRDIRSLQQFWESMEYRQECAAGRLVGFVWVVFESGHQSRLVQVEAQATADATSSNAHSELLSTGVPEGSHQLPEQVSPVDPGSVVVTHEQYITLSDLLLNDTDFAGLELAVKSTSEWINKVKALTDLQQFGTDIEGQRLAAPTSLDQSHMNGPGPVTAGTKHARDEDAAAVTAAPSVNVLTGIRKKKQKITPQTSVSEEQESKTNTNGTSDDHTMKSRGDNDTSNDVVEIVAGGPNNVVAKEESGVKTLAAGLVKKKPKVTVA